MSDKAFVVIGLALIGLITWLTISPFIDSSFNLNQEIQISAKTLFLIFGGVMAMFCFYVIIPFIIEPYFTARKRTTYPIQS